MSLEAKVEANIQFDFSFVLFNSAWSICHTDMEIAASGRFTDCLWHLPFALVNNLAVTVRG